MMEYLRAIEKAEQCLAQAGNTSDPESRASFARLAEAYLHLAELLPKDQ
jgi:hypothetical protein